MSTSSVTTIILAGGRGRRMGGLDKGLINFSGKPIIEYILTAISPQCEAIIINANRHINLYKKYGHPVLTDELNDFQGPLAGFSIGLEQVTTDLVLTLPCDAPFVPHDMVQRMLTAMQKTKADIAVAHDGDRIQPVYALIKTQLAANLKTFLLSGERKIDRWYAENNTTLVDFSDVQHIFQNINTPEQQEAMQQVEHTV